MDIVEGVIMVLVVFANMMLLGWILWLDQRDRESEHRRNIAVLAIDRAPDRSSTIAGHYLGRKQQPEQKETVEQNFS